MNFPKIKMALAAFSLSTALIATPALASGIGPYSTWNQIYDAGLEAQFPSIQFKAVFVPADEVCFAPALAPMPPEDQAPEKGKGQQQKQAPLSPHQDELRTIYPITYCDEWSGQEESKCVHEVTKHLSTPLKYSKKLDIGSEGNSKIITVEAEHALSYDIPVGHPAIEGSMMPLFYKTYDMRDCVN